MFPLLHIKKIAASLLLLCVMTGCSGKENNLRKEGSSELNMRIVQDGIEKDIVNNEAAIYRKPFVIEFKFRGKDSVFINASFNSASFLSAEAKRPAAEIDGFSGTVISEELFNRDEILTLSETNQNFWHYSNENDHSFNEIKEENGAIICSRKITSFQTEETEKNRVPLTDITEETLYLVIMKLEWNKDFSQKIEKNRKVIKLTFMNVESDEIPRKSESEKNNE
jgi:hypothetical protein